MSFAKVYTVTQSHLKSEIITVEADVSKGLHHFAVVGLADKTVEESKERCSLAIKHTGLRSPRASNEKILISLAPAHIRKSGTVFDIAISIGYLIASDQIRCDVSDTIFLGELSLNGEVKRVKGIIPMIQKAITEGYSEVCIPFENKEEAQVLARHIKIIPLKTLKECINHISKTKLIPKIKFTKQNLNSQETFNTVLFDHIRGNEVAKRALLIALCGGHNICLYGPPGTGKTMLAKASASALPELTFDEQVELTSIYSLSSEYQFRIQTNPPFRSPHHSASYTSIVGGGKEIVPGEITLSHRGILFLDEFPEFERRVIDSLRQPLEDRKICISRAGQKVEFPCNFQLICSMNPCPCGYLHTGIRECICAPAQIQKYNKKISGPILDRIGMWVEVSKISYEKLGDTYTLDSVEHDTIKQSISQSHTIQKTKYGALSAHLSNEILIKSLSMSKELKEYYDLLAARLHISARSYFNVLKIALTISILENSDVVCKEHVLEALSYRPSEKLSSI